MKKRLIPAFILLAYGAILIKVMVFKNIAINVGFTIFRLTTDAGQTNFVPFKTILHYLSGAEGWTVSIVNLVGNIALLVPIGFFAPFVFRKMTWPKALALAIASGLAIELTQVVFRVGIFDIDDVILNALGVLIGYLIFAMLLGSRNENASSASKAWQSVVIVAALCLVIVGSWWLYTRPIIVPSVNVSADNLDWPSFGQSAVGIADSATLETHGTQTPVPTASTAKLITALMVLNAKPLMLGQSGPSITMTRDDIALLNKYTGLDGSKVGKVLVGEQLTEYQMLEAMLLPSANNMADSLAIWAYGSLPAYSAAANKFLADQGINDTHVGTDASGFDPSTVSTAEDMVRIGKLVMQQPVLAQIVAKQSVDGFPLIGNLTNTNTLLGQNGIVGIKTGNSDEQSGAFVGAARISINGQPATIVTAVLGAPNLNDAMESSLSLIKSVETNNFSNGEGTIPQSGDLCSGTGGNGKIASVGSNSFTMTRNDNGKNQTVHLTSDATIQTSAGPASLSDLKIGDAVTLVGGPNSDGSFTATDVVVCGGASQTNQSETTNVSSDTSSTETAPAPSRTTQKLRR